MRTFERQNVDSDPVNPSRNAHPASEVGDPLTQSQAEFLYLIGCQGYRELSQSLQLVHDLALYHSNIPFGDSEKAALFDLKLLWEGFEKMAKA
ncbi:hypothetical protein [Dyadobacter luticola]|uniref:Uncharacterized protein n=1 Tax=Dyadobacter luticola TaxID=1979387 RepID=A0A5R9L2V7_9BACT|nr:hypothetical protein [Dyadobacter luticola]TLV02912.1 hypothetical protein FEN17_04675 [Dyadobacter luticola]